MQNPLQNILSKLSPRGRFKKWLAFWFLLIVGGYAVYFVFDFLEPERVLVTISKETTYITEPLKENGYPDYLTYVNQSLSEGVTRENNAYVTILRIAGPPRFEDPVCEREYYQWLGMKPLPSERNYFQPYSDFGFKLHKEIEEKYAYTEEETRILMAPAPDPEDQSADAIAYRKMIESPEYKERERIRERLTNEDFLEKPWTAKDYPEAAEWLVKQEPILERLAELEKRPKFFAPFDRAKNENSLVSSTIPHVDLMRKVANIIVARANFAIGAGNRENGFKSVRILFKLADYLHDGPSETEQSVGNVVERMAEAPLNHLVQDPKTTIEEITAIENDYKQLHKSDVIKAMDQFDRLNYLSFVCESAENGINESELFATGCFVTLPNSPRGKSSFFIRKRVDHDWILRDGNADFDQAVKILQISDPVAQETARSTFDNRLKGVSSEKSNNLDDVIDFFSSKTSRSAHRAMKFKNWAGPHINYATIYQDNHKMARELQIVSFALARYRVKNGKYPIDFAELKSEGISAIPTDIFKQSPCVYSSDGTGFLLYSVGSDGKDAGGFSGKVSNDRSDDIAVFSPNREPKAPVQPEPESDDKIDREAAPVPMTENPKTQPTEK